MGSFSSMPVNTFKSSAASFTVRVIGPAVSWVAEIGIIPDRLSKPTVGLIPTIPQNEAGAIMEPSVSVPMATVQKLAATAAPEPELDPQGFRSRLTGFFVWPPRLLHPLVERVDLKFAHSLKFVLPRITAPERRSCL